MSLPFNARCFRVAREINGESEKKNNKVYRHKAINLGSNVFFPRFANGCFRYNKRLSISEDVNLCFGILMI